MYETIFALSSGGLPSGVAVVRISGPKVRFVLETMCGAVPAPRHAAYRPIRNAAGDVIDRGLVLFFPAPASFTGEDCAEFQVHGSRAVVSSLLETLGKIAACRQAEPGEFTRRAFENGKFDLTAVEGLADLLAAETEKQRRAALDQASGRLKARYTAWMRDLTHARAMIEAEFDFSDEGDIPGSVSDRIWPAIEALRRDIARHLAGLHRGEIVRDGFRIVLAGAPNAGKSSLLNRLADRDVAIVSERPGTTRDALEVRLDIGGFLVVLSDTAGLRESDDEIEQEGIRRAQAAIAAADLVLLLAEPSRSDPAVERLLGPLPPARLVRIATKSDLWSEGSVPDGYDLALSAKTGAGIDRLVERIARELGRLGPLDEALPNRERHRVLLREALEALDQAVEARSGGLELAAEGLRRASDSLGRITGAVDVEDLLGVIFQEFCVGK